jgi:hypothetical protein
MSRFAVLSSLVLLFASSTPPVIGPYEVLDEEYIVPALDSTDQRMWLHYPKATDASVKFPLISYLHGLLGGGNLNMLGYSAHFRQLASYGFIVAAPLSCNTGCKDANQGAPYTNCAGLLPLQPLGQGWSSYYGEQLKVIEFAKNMSASSFLRPASMGKVDPFHLIDWKSGVGIAGHSMVRCADVISFVWWLCCGLFC